jgi:virulence-associated protein VapD
MADIYDLVQQGLARGRRDKSQFDDPLIDMALQIPKMIQSERDRKNVANRDAITNIASLINSVNTPEGFANISASLNKLSKESGGDTELDTNIDILKGINKNSQQNYNTYKEGIDRGLEYIDSDSFPKEMKDYQDLGQIAFNADFKNEDGTGNTLQYLYAEKEKINTIMDKLALGTDGKKQRFSYGGGVDRGVLRKLQRHNDQIDIAVQTLAGDGIITKEEAYHIMVGKSEFYAEDKKKALAEAKSVIDLGLRTDISLNRILGKASLDDDDHDILSGYDINSRELVGTEAGRKSIDEDIKGFIKMNMDRTKINNQKHKDWSGRDYDPTLRFGTPQHSDDKTDKETDADAEKAVDAQAGTLKFMKKQQESPTNIEEESEGMSLEAMNSPVLKQKVFDINKIKSDLNNFNEIGQSTTHVRDRQTGRDLKLKKPRTEKTQLEQLLNLNLGENVSINRIYELRDKTLPEWKNRKTEITSRMKEIRKLYPKSNDKDMPISTKEEYENIRNELSQLNFRIQQGNRFFESYIGSYKENGWALIKNYEKSINKLNQAEKNLETFKSKHRAK